MTFPPRRRAKARLLFQNGGYFALGDLPIGAAGERHTMFDSELANERRDAVRIAAVAIEYEDALEARAKN